jgi:hypothetical protein
LRVEEIDSAAARDSDKRIGFCFFTVELHGLEVEAGKAADDFKVAQLFGSGSSQFRPWMEYCIAAANQNC